jgi:hypothetical protein
MIPFSHTLPYDSIRNDMYVNVCPYCSRENVLLPLKKRDLTNIQGGAKRLLVFPCCHSKLVVLDADNDYLLTDQPLRKP